MKRGFIGVLLVFVFSFAFVSSFELHGYDEFYVSVDGVNYNLQEAYYAGLLSGSHVYADPSVEDLPDQSHVASDFFISTNYGEYNIVDALNGNSICKTSNTDSYLTVPSSLSFHFAKNVSSFLSGYGNFQDLIDSGDLARVDGDWGSWSGWSGCSVSCGYGIQTRSRSCNSPSPFCGGTSCTGDSVQTKSCYAGACYHWTSVASCSGYIDDGWCSGVTAGASCTSHNHCCAVNPGNSRIAVLVKYACI